MRQTRASIGKLTERTMLEAAMLSGRWTVQQRQKLGAEWRVANMFGAEDDAQETARAIRGCGLQARIVSPSGNIISTIVSGDAPSGRWGAESRTKKTTECSGCAAGL